jgi:hypothetical protein
VARSSRSAIDRNREPLGVTIAVSIGMLRNAESVEPDHENVDSSPVVVPTTSPNTAQCHDRLDAVARRAGSRLPLLTARSPRPTNDHLRACANGRTRTLPTQAEIVIHLAILQ